MLQDKNRRSVFQSGYFTAETPGKGPEATGTGVFFTYFFPLRHDLKIGDRKRPHRVFQWVPTETYGVPKNIYINGAPFPAKEKVRYCIFPYWNPILYLAASMVNMKKFILFLFLVFSLSSQGSFSQEQDFSLFAVPPLLKDNVAFWKKIYTEVGLHEGVFHDRDYPLVIYKKIRLSSFVKVKLLFMQLCLA